MLLFMRNPSPDSSGNPFYFSLKIKRLERVAGNSFENLSIFINRFKKKPLLIKVTALY
jgi:hypothetical protein